MESKEKNTVLYLGIDPRHFKTQKRIIHMPLVEIVPRESDSLDIKKTYQSLSSYTHIIFTSKSSVRIFFSYLKANGLALDALHDKHIIAVGQLTAFYVKEEGIAPTYIAGDETEEGIIKVLASLDLKSANILLPKSSAQRSHLVHFLVEHEVRYHICILYDMYEKIPLEPISLEDIDEVVFTMPLAVDAFFNLYGEPPSAIRLHPMGNATREALREKLSEIVSDVAYSI